MANDLTNFIPEVWSKKLSALLDDSGVMMQCVNKDYEGEIKSAGDTIHVRTYGNVTVKTYNGAITYDDLTSPTQELNIDQKKYFAFKVDDISKAQSNIEIMDGYLGRAKIAIDLAKDDFLLAKHSDIATADTVSSGATIALDADNIYQYFVELGKILKANNATAKGQKPWVIINPEIEATMLQANQFIHATQIGDKTIREGSIGRINGMDVLVSTNFDAVGGVYNVMAGTNDAISFASQVVEVETIRLQDSFDTAVRGLYVYGAKTTQAKSLAKLICTV